LEWRQQQQAGTPAHGIGCPFDIQPVGVDFGGKNHDEVSNNNHGNNNNINNILQTTPLPFFRST
jgi:hypothetical protein